MANGIQFLDLPPEIHLKILENLPQHDIVHHIRLTCRQLKDEVDDMCAFTVDLDDRTPPFQSVLRLRIKSLKVLHLLRPPPTGPSGTTLLHHPQLLRVLKVSEHISPSNLFYLLSDTCPHLTDLKLFLGSNVVNFDFPPLFNFDFQRVARLEVIVSTLSCASLENSSEAVPFSPFINSRQNKQIVDIFSEFALNTFPCLQTLKVQIRCFGFSQVSSFVSTTLGFVGRHWGTLENLDFELILGHGMPSPDFQPVSPGDLERIDMSLLRKVRKLKGLRMVSSSPVGVDLWLDLLSEQGQLLYWEVDIFPAPVSLFKDVTQHNSDTLLSIEITDLSVWDEEGNCHPWDVRVFQGCQRLKKLILDRNVTRRRAFDRAELINLFDLPPSTEEVALNYFNILSDELILLANSEAGMNLRTIYLTQCGNSGLYGVDGTVLERIIEMPRIHFIEISPLNFSDPEERDRLNIILDTFGYAEDHSYFQLTKTTAIFPISSIQAFMGEDEEEEDEEEDEQDYNDLHSLE